MYNLIFERNVSDFILEVKMLLDILNWVYNVLVNNDVGVINMVVILN